jgi:hypothetical protein
MVDSVQASVEEDTPFWEMFFCLFATTLASFLGLLVTAFFAFHIWLMTKSMTTIDFCEKALKKTSYENNIYDLGLWGNIKAVLGPNPILFLLPVSTPVGDGLTYMLSPVDENSRLTTDFTQQEKSRKKGNGIVHRARHDAESGGYAATENASRVDEDPPSSVGVSMAPTPESTQVDVNINH